MVPLLGATEKIPSDTTGNCFWERPTSSAVPQPLRYPRPLKDMHVKIYQKTQHAVSQPIPVTAAHSVEMQS